MSLARTSSTSSTRDLHEGGAARFLPRRVWGEGLRCFRSFEIPGRGTDTPNMTRMHGEKLSAWLLVAATVGLMVLLAAQGIDAPSAVEFTFWVALLLTAELLPVSLGFRTQVTMSFPVTLAVAIHFHAQPAIAMAIAGLGSFDIREVRREIPLWHALFNRAQLMLAVAAAAAVIAIVGGRPFVQELDPQRSWPFVWPLGAVAIALAAAVHFMVNLGLVSIWVNRFRGVPLVTILFMAAVMLPCALLVVRVPEDIGILPDGTATPQPSEGGRELDARLSAVIQTPQFWMVLAGCFIGSFSLVASTVILLPYFQEVGCGLSMSREQFDGILRDHGISWDWQVDLDTRGRSRCPKAWPDCGTSPAPCRAWAARVVPTAKTIVRLCRHPSIAPCAPRKHRLPRL
jgi:ABC-type amino acid transport system permease subunit